MRTRWMVPLLALSALLLLWLGFTYMRLGHRAATAVPALATGEAAPPTGNPAPPPATGASGTAPSGTPPTAPSGTPPTAPPRIEIHGDDLLLGSYRGKLPDKTVAYGVRTILLPGVPEEVAHIELTLCPGAIPVEAGCIGNHRAPAGTREIAVAGLQTRAYVVDYSAPSAADDARVWQEIHTFLPLPSGDRLDILGVVLKESGKEKALNEAYQRLLGSVRRND